MKEKYSYKFTVFTPTYNRGYIINKLYESLCNQSYKDFEWLVIDQGNDKTESIIERYKDEQRITINYVRYPYQEKGINRSYNYALNIAGGELFFKVDDDDYLTSDALELLNIWVSDTSKENMIAGVAGLRRYEDGRINGGEWKIDRNFIDASNFERAKYGLMGDKAECYYTEILRQYGPFPEIPGERYTDEGMLYNRIANAGYKVRWFDMPIYVTEYLDDGITKHLEEVQRRNLQTYRLMISEYTSYKQFSIFYRLKLLCRYFEVCHYNKWDYAESVKEMQIAKSLCRLGWILSYITRLKKRKQLA